MIKVATYNMRKSIGTDRQRRPERTLQVLAEIGADIVALQEADRRFGKRTALLTHLLAEHSPWKAVPFGVRATSMGWHGNALLIPQSAEVVDCEIIHLPALEPRGAVMSDVRLASGLIIRIVGMHLDLSGLWRRRQAASIIAHVGASTVQRPTILMGDLNDWTSQSGCLRDFAAHYAFADTGKSFHARKPVARLDRIMCTRDLKFSEAGVHDSPSARTASDHLPVWATVETA